MTQMLEMVGKSAMVGVAEPSRAAESVGVVKPPEVTGPVEVAKPMEMAEPVEAVMPVEATKPGGVVKQTEIIGAGAKVCCLYRVSNKSQAWLDANGQADIPGQREVCREFARKNGWEVVKEEQEIGVSGYKTDLNDRPALQRIRQNAESGEFGILLVSVFDRLGRQADEVHTFAKDLAQIGIRVWSVNEGEQRFDSTADCLANHAVYLEAETESKKESIRINTAHGQMVLEGFYHGGPIPYGYRSVSSGVLEINEEEASVVRKMFDLCGRKEYTSWAIATALREESIVDRNAKNWSPASVGNILKNVLYTGILHYGEKHSDVIPELQIIPPAFFFSVQNLRMSRINTWNETKTPFRNIAGMALLSETGIFCGHCGGALSLTTFGPVRKTMTGADAYRKRIRYICRGKTRHRTDCDGQTGYTAHKLDSMVETAICQTLDRFCPLDSDAENFVTATSSDMHAISRRLDAAEAEFSKISNDRNDVKNYLDSLRERNGNRDIITMISELDEEVKKEFCASEARVSNLKNRLAQSKMQLEEIAEMQNQIRSKFHNWSEAFSNMDMPFKKEVAKLLINKVTVCSGYQLDIEFNSDFSCLNLAQAFLLSNGICCQGNSDSVGACADSNVF